MVAAVEWDESERGREMTKGVMMLWHVVMSLVRKVVQLVVVVKND